MVKENTMKDSEIGLIPEDWKVERLGDIAFVTKLAGFEYSKYFNSYKDGGEIIVIRGTNITKNKLDLADTKYIPKKISDFLHRSKLSKGDLVFAYVGTIGPIYFVNENDRFHLGPNTAKIKIEDKEVDTSYILNFFLSEFIRKQIEDRISVGAQPSLSMSKIRDFSLPIPPIDEQKAIASILRDCNAWIESLEQVIVKKCLIKQGAMQELLTPNEKWEVKKLKEVAEIIMGQSPLSQFYNQDGRGLPLVQGNADIDNRKTIIRNFTSNITKRGKAGDIIMSVRAPVGEIVTSTFDCCLGRGVCAFRSPNNYLYHYLIFAENQWAQYSTGSTFDSVNSNQINEFKIHIPKSLTEQTRIANILSDIDLEIEILEQKLNKVRQIKQGMMQELLTGKTRLV